MATLTITSTFEATHGTRQVHRSVFAVQLSIAGPLDGDFVQRTDDLELHRSLENALDEVRGQYLDDVVGRATLENVGMFLLVRLHRAVHSIKSLAVSVGASQVTLEASEVNQTRLEAELAFRRGVSLLLRSHSTAALTEFSTALSAAPDWALAYNARGRCFRKLGRTQEAIADYDHAIRIDPDFGEAYRNRANVVLELLGAKNALLDFDHAILLLPESALAYNNRGFAFRLLGELERALDDHTRAIALDPNYEEAYRDRAVVWTALGNDSEAAADLANADKLVSITDHLEIERCKLMNMVQRRR